MQTHFFPEVSFQQSYFIYQWAFNSSIILLVLSLNPCSIMETWLNMYMEEVLNVVRKQNSSPWEILHEQHQNCLFFFLFCSPQVQYLSQTSPVSLVCLPAYLPGEGCEKKALKDFCNYTKWRHFSSFSRVVSETVCFVR